MAAFTAIAPKYCWNNFSVLVRVRGRATGLVFASCLYSKFRVCRVLLKYYTHQILEPKKGQVVSLQGSVLHEKWMNHSRSSFNSEI